MLSFFLHSEEVGAIINIVVVQGMVYGEEGQAFHAVIEFVLP